MQRRWIVRGCSWISSSRSRAARGRRAARTRALRTEELTSGKRRRQRPVINPCHAVSVSSCLVFTYCGMCFSCSSWLKWGEWTESAHGLGLAVPLVWPRQWWRTNFIPSSGSHSLRSLLSGTALAPAQGQSSSTRLVTQPCVRGGCLAQRVGPCPRRGGPEDRRAQCLVASRALAHRGIWRDDDGAG